MNFWDSIFQDGAVWSYEPADSAIFAADYFLKSGICNVLIPGIGYGRNSTPFIDKGIGVTGIEISLRAIETAKNNDLKTPIHHGSVLNMPFDNIKYDGIYCYAVLHLFNRNERKLFLTSCYNQLSENGIMIFVVVSVKSNMYGQGKLLSKNRYQLNNGLKIFFYDEKAIINEFTNFEVLEYSEINEPIKHMKDEPPLQCYKIVARKKAGM
ncbi:MAG: class I SAM-dependent methyltransferase [Bacteroidetes bacterium]|nr:class I SAM-dependent methyltransferase [Bacteroidota bacterium]